MTRTTIDLPIRRDVPLYDQCSHGKLWKETCVECEIVWLTHSLERDEPRVARDRAKLNQLLAARQPWCPNCDDTDPHCMACAGEGFKRKQPANGMAGEEPSSRRQENGALSRSGSQT